MTLSTLLCRPLHMVNIRAGRAKPGLRPQHLEAVRACRRLSGGTVRGDEVGSSEIHYVPGRGLEGGEHAWDIGTAGSTTMLAHALLPVALFSRTASRYTLTGGLFQDFAPSAHHMREVLLPILAKMGIDARAKVVRPGYVPRGQGVLVVEATPRDGPLDPLGHLERGKVTAVGGIALASHLENRQVCERLADRSRALLSKHGYDADIVLEHDEGARQKGASLTLWAVTDSGMILGADRAGRVGRSSESMAEYVVRNLLEDLESGAATDRHTADQLILFAALARGRSRYRVPRVTDHVRTNLWLAREILGARAEIFDDTVTIDGIGWDGNTSR